MGVQNSPEAFEPLQQHVSDLVIDVQRRCKEPFQLATVHISRKAEVR